MQNIHEESGSGGVVVLIHEHIRDGSSSKWEVGAGNVRPASKIDGARVIGGSRLCPVCIVASVGGVVVKRLRYPRDDWRNVVLSGIDFTVGSYISTSTAAGEIGIEGLTLGTIQTWVAVTWVEVDCLAVVSNEANRAITEVVHISIVAMEGVMTDATVVTDRSASQVADV